MTKDLQSEVAHTMPSHKFSRTYNLDGLEIVDFGYGGKCHVSEYAPENGPDEQKLHVKKLLVCLLFKWRLG